jgi:hypothetical protein
VLNWSNGQGWYATLGNRAVLLDRESVNQLAAFFQELRKNGGRGLVTAMF